jgi:hypothetical protein
MPEGTTHESVASIADVLTSIAGQYVVVRSFDATGAHTFDPTIPPFFNDLTYIAGGYGYWINMIGPAQLSLEGPPLDPAVPLPLHDGWNLVGYWRSDVRYKGLVEPTAAFPDGVGFTSVSSISDILTSIIDLVTVVRSFDAEGAHTFDPNIPEFFNDLDYIGPGYGYWVKVTAGGALDWGNP